MTPFQTLTIKRVHRDGRTLSFEETPVPYVSVGRLQKDIQEGWLWDLYEDMSENFRPPVLQ